LVKPSTSRGAVLLSGTSWTRLRPSWLGRPDQLAAGSTSPPRTFSRGWQATDPRPLTRRVGTPGALGAGTGRGSRLWWVYRECTTLSPLPDRSVVGRSLRAAWLSQRQLAAHGFNLRRETLNPKVEGSNPSRPIRTHAGLRDLIAPATTRGATEGATHRRWRPARSRWPGPAPSLTTPGEARTEWALTCSSERTLAQASEGAICSLARHEPPVGTPAPSRLNTARARRSRR